MKNKHFLFLMFLLLIGFGSLLTPKAEASRGFSNSDSYLPNGYYNNDCTRYAFSRNCGSSYYNNLNSGYRYSGYNNGYNGYTNGYYNDYDNCTRYAFGGNCGNTSYYNNQSSHYGYYNNYYNNYVNGYSYNYNRNSRYNYNDGYCNYYRC